MITNYRNEIIAYTSNTPPQHRRSGTTKDYSKSEVKTMISSIFREDSLNRSLQTIIFKSTIPILLRTTIDHYAKELIPKSDEFPMLSTVTSIARTSGLIISSYVALNFDAPIKSTQKDETTIECVAKDAISQTNQLTICLLGYELYLTQTSNEPDIKFLVMIGAIAIAKLAMIQPSPQLNHNWSGMAEQKLCGQLLVGITSLLKLINTNKDFVQGAMQGILAGLTYYFSKKELLNQCYPILGVHIIQQCLAKWSRNDNDRLMINSLPHVVYIHILITHFITKKLMEIKSNISKQELQQAKKILATIDLDQDPNNIPE